MASPLHYQQPSSHTSSTTSTRHRRKSSTVKPGLIKRTSSTTSLHRKSNSSTALAHNKGGKHHHHAHHTHVAHTSASKVHHRTSFGHRVPSYGKGLNKLTALTTVNTDDAAPKEFLSVHSIVDRAAGGTGMQRSHSEGSGMFLYSLDFIDCL